MVVRTTPLWTEGVCGDGAAILRDGVMVPIEEVIDALNHREALRLAQTRLSLSVEYRLPTHDQCAAKVRARDASCLELFIHNYEPAAPKNHEWRLLLASALSESTEEDRSARAPEKIVR